MSQSFECQADILHQISNKLARCINLSVVIINVIHVIAVLNARADVVCIFSNPADDRPRAIMRARRELSEVVSRVLN